MQVTRSVGAKHIPLHDHKGPQSGTEGGYGVTQARLRPQRGSSGPWLSRARQGAGAG